MGSTRIIAAAGLVLALVLPASAFAQTDNLNDRRPSTQKAREQIILQLKKTHFIERIDVHGARGDVYVGYDFYNPNMVRSERTRYVRIIAGHVGAAELDYATRIIDGRIGIPIGEFTNKAGLVLTLPPPLANRPHRQPPPLVPEQLPRDDDRLLEVLVNWFDSGVLWKYDDSDPNRPKLYVGSPTFFDGIFDHHQRKTILETAGRYYTKTGQVSLLLNDNETKAQFGTYTREKGLVLTPSAALAHHFQVPAAPQLDMRHPSQVPQDNPRTQDLNALSCQQLWQARNSIFARNGFCFTSPEAQAVFGKGCFPPFGRLSSSEDREVKAIVALETAKACQATVPQFHAASQARALDVPVMVGTDGPNLSACAGNGEIVGLDPRGDGYLSVQSGPGGRPFKEVDRLFNGQAVHTCEHRGDWIGVVYKPSNVLEMDCNVITSWSTAQAYTGPCRVGWVHRRYVRLVAG